MPSFHSEPNINEPAEPFFFLFFFFFRQVRQTFRPAPYLGRCVHGIRLIPFRHTFEAADRRIYGASRVGQNNDAVSGAAPPYLSELLHHYSAFRSLRSASNTRIFCVPRMGWRTLGERSFQYIGSVFWNSLPLSVRHLPSLYSFHSN